jgi:hypothetical protein
MGTMDAAAYVMRRRSTFVNPITLSARISNTGLTTTTSITGRTIELSLEANNNNNKRLSASSYRESVC